MFRILSLAICVGTMASAVSSATVQWKSSDGGNDHFYELMAGPPITWDSARADAISQGGYLATITSDAENAFLTALYPTQAWIGGSDAETEGVWKWADGPEGGNLISYFKWRPGDPNDTNGTQNYLHWLGDDGGQMVDSITVIGLGTYIVEWDTDPNIVDPVAPVPVPATLPLLFGSLGVLGFLARRRAQTER